MNVRAKFTVSKVAFTSKDRSAGSIHLTPVTADEVPENQRFHKWTPSGEIVMYVNNPAVLEEMRRFRNAVIEKI